MIELRDTLAAQIAATLANSSMAPPQIARRAYAVADAMLLERSEPCFLDDSYVAERTMPEPVVGIMEDEPSHDPRWELSPRWSREDLAALEARRRGPGLAKPNGLDTEDEAQRTG